MGKQSRNTKKSKTSRSKMKSGIKAAMTYSNQVANNGVKISGRLKHKLNTDQSSKKLLQSIDDSILERSNNNWKE